MSGGQGGYQSYKVNQSDQYSNYISNEEVKVGSSQAKKRNVV